MPQIKGVHHISVTPVKEDYQKTLDFYQNILGFKLLGTWEKLGNKFAMLNCGDDTILEIIDKGEVAKASDGPFNHVAFSCDEVDEMIEIVRNAGYEVTLEPKESALGFVPPCPIRIAFFRGPINEHIEIFKVY